MDSYHYRLHMSGASGSGRYEFCGLADGFFVTFGDPELATPHSAYMSYPDTLQVYVASNGDGEYVFPHGDPLSFEAPTTAIIIEPAGEPDSETAFAGDNRFVHVAIHLGATPTELRRRGVLPAN